MDEQDGVSERPQVEGMEEFFSLLNNNSNFLNELQAEVRQIWVRADDNSSAKLKESRRPATREFIR
jgi:hypothetical protein